PKEVIQLQPVPVCQRQVGSFADRAVSAGADSADGQPSGTEVLDQTPQLPVREVVDRSSRPGVPGPCSPQNNDQYQRAGLDRADPFHESIPPPGPWQGSLQPSRALAAHTDLLKHPEKVTWTWLNRDARSRRGLRGAPAQIPKGDLPRTFGARAARRQELALSAERQ